MIKPKSNEKEKDYVSRCVSDLMDEDPTHVHKQAIAMCHSKFKRNTIKEKLSTFSDLKEQEVFYVDKGLTREEARKLTINKIKQDHRGFNYDPKTGKCIYI